VALGERIIPTKYSKPKDTSSFLVGGGGLVGDGGVANNPKDIPLGRTEPRTASTVSLGSVIAIVTFFGAGA
jgi:hypothetical protein